MREQEQIIKRPRRPDWSEFLVQVPLGESTETAARTNKRQWNGGIAVCCVLIRGKEKGPRTRTGADRWAFSAAIWWTQGSRPGLASATVSQR